MSASKQKGEVVTTLRLITPEVAETILKGNTNNRNISKKSIERMVYAMKNDQWKNNGETIKISATGRLLDGQHRLNAVIQSKCSCLMLVCEGLEEDTIDTIDIGKRRTFGDWLNINGEQNYGLLSAALHRLAVYQNYYVKNAYVYSTRGVRNMNYPDLEALLASHPGLRHSVSFAAKTESRHLFDRSTLAVMHYLFQQIDATKADDFFNSLASGANLTEDSPILLLRQTALRWKAQNHKAEIYEVMTFIIRCWNAHYSKRIIQHLRFNPEEGFPPIVGLPDPDNQAKLKKVERNEGIGKGKLVRKGVVKARKR